MEGTVSKTEVVDMLLDLRLKVQNIQSEDDTEYLKEHIDEKLKELGSD